MEISQLLSSRRQDAKSVRVTIAGDWAPLPFYQSVMRNDPVAVYGDLLPVLRASTLNVVNVECVLGIVGEPIPKGGPCLRSDADFVSALAAVPFHVATLANNHSMDYGPESLLETRAVLQAAKVHCVGAGATGEEAAQPLLVERGGLRIAILNCGEGEACASLDNGPGAHRMDVPVQTRQIRALRTQADAVIVIVHGGREHTPVPPPYFVEALRAFAEAGADAVIAHHAHVPQGIEFFGGVPIVYSLGNFIFQPQDNLHYTVIGYLAHLDFVAGARASLSITPYETHPLGVRCLEGEKREEFKSDMERVTRLLSDTHFVRQMWDAFGDVMGEGNLTGCIQAQLTAFSENPRTSAAVLHNIFFAPAHREYYLHNLKRIANGTFGDSPAWARNCVWQWMQRRIGESPETTLARYRPISNTANL